MTDSLLICIVVLIDDVGWSLAMETEETHDAMTGRSKAS